MAISDFFNQTVDVLSPPDTQEKDRFGAPSRQFVKLGTIACCIQEATANERLVNGQRGVVVTHKCWYQPGDLVVTHRMRLQASRNGSTRTYRVHSQNDIQQRGRHTKLMLEEHIDDGG